MEVDYLEACFHSRELMEVKECFQSKGPTEMDSVGLETNMLGSREAQGMETFEC